MVALCCSVLRGIAGSRNAFQCVRRYAHDDLLVLQCVAVCCSALRGIVGCCSLLQCLRNFARDEPPVSRVLQHVAACCSVLQCLAESCIVFAIMPGMSSWSFVC